MTKAAKWGGGFSPGSRIEARLSANPRFAAFWCAIAAFGAYGCMYAFRKPFTAGVYEDPPFGPGYKVWLVTAQVLGYTLSKFLGVKIVAEADSNRRGLLLLLLILSAEAALVLFAMAPAPYKAFCLFLNGLPLGMVFGLVLGFLEGRRLTEAFVAGVCASFILADGFTKSVGSFLLSRGVSESWMPSLSGLFFLPALCGFVWMLRRIPRPSDHDVSHRSERVPMNRNDRRSFFRRYAPGLLPITLAYLLATIIRSLRADFAPELWAGLGEGGKPELFTTSEILVALGVSAANGLSVLIANNRRAFFASLGLSIGGFILVVLALIALRAGRIDAFPFMVLLGLGVYLPYVAVHTTLFERLIAMTRERGNIGFLMYVADAAGYLGYVLVMLWRNFRNVGDGFLFFFETVCWIASLASIAALAGSIYFFSRGSTGTDAALLNEEAAGLRSE